MTGSNSFWFANPSSGFYNGVATQSLRFDDGSSTYLNKTFSSSGSRNKWTFSAWVKKSTLDIDGYLIGVGTGSAFELIKISNSSTDQLEYAYWNGSAYAYQVRATALFRDTTNWYHVVIAADTTQSTASNRVKFYVNGTQLTDFSISSYPSEDADTQINHSVDTRIGSGIGGNYFDGYMAEVNFIDGSQLAPTSFGETKNGVWIPKDTSGLTFGTNGYRLQFKQTGTGTASTSTIGADTANSNHFTSNNLASTDSNLPDCPEDNYPTMNPLHKGADAITFTEGNLKSSFTSDVDDTHHGCTFALPKEGKWYWEQTFTGADTGGSQAPYCGIYDSDTLALGISDNLFTTSGDFITYYTHNNAIYISGSSTNYTGSIGNQSGAVVGFAVDMDGGHCWVHVNGTYINGTPTFSDGTNKVASPNTDSTYIPFWSGNGGGVMTWEANFGQASFTGTIPTGYSKLTSANLPEPTISPNADTQADDHFNIVLYTANNQTAQSITGVGFQPDWLWFKQRNRTDSHALYNTVRGIDKNMRITTDTEFDDSNSETGVTAVGADGFTLGTDAQAWVNYQTDSMVAWLWKAGGNHADVSGNFIKDGVAFTPTQGTIDANKMSVNTTAGFSIVEFTSDISSDVGESGTPPTIAHGIGVKPTLVIVKDTDGGSYPHWNVWHQGYQPDATYLNYQLFLQANSASNNAGWHRTDTGFTTNLFTPPRYQYNETGKTYICYVFAEVEGYSKFGSYVGNGSTDGTYIHLGFKPSFFMLKSASATGNWMIYDNKRDPDNRVAQGLFPNLNSAESEQTGGFVDFVSNGVKCKEDGSAMNGSGVTYIYMAFAEMPEKYSLAR